jgi:DNA repair protein RecO (recombination protein O)
MRERVYRTEALILRRSDIGEADRLLVLCTPSGKQHVVARGARKTTSRLAGHLELFTYATIMLAVGRSRDVVTQSQVLNGFPALRCNLSRLGFAYYMAELYELWGREHEENRPLFSLLVQAFAALETTIRADMLMRAVEMRLLDVSGYRPRVQQCVVCEAPLTEQANRFSVSMGGVLCPIHAQHDPHALPMSLATFKVLRYMQREPLDAVERLALSADVRDELETLLQAYLSAILGRTLKTVPFLDSLRDHAATHHDDIPGSDSVSTTRELHHGIYR